MDPRKKNLEMKHLENESSSINIDAKVEDPEVGDYPFSEDEVSEKGSHESIVNVEELGYRNVSQEDDKSPVIVVTQGRLLWASCITNVIVISIGIVVAVSNFVHLDRC
jgi:hypothetical protein